MGHAIACSNINSFAEKEEWRKMFCTFPFKPSSHLQPFPMSHVSICPLKEVVARWPSLRKTQLEIPSQLLSRDFTFCFVVLWQEDIYEIRIERVVRTNTIYHHWEYSENARHVKGGDQGTSKIKKGMKCTLNPGCVHLLYLNIWIQVNTGSITFSIKCAGALLG